MWQLRPQHFVSDWGNAIMPISSEYSWRQASGIVITFCWPVPSQPCVLLSFLIFDNMSLWDPALQNCLTKSYPTTKKPPYPSQAHTTHNIPPQSIRNCIQLDALGLEHATCAVDWCDFGTRHPLGSLAWCSRHILESWQNTPWDAIILTIIIEVSQLHQLS